MSEGDSAELVSVAHQVHHADKRYKEPVLSRMDMRRAAEMWLNMEDGISPGGKKEGDDDPNDWMYPPPHGEKVSTKEIYFRIAAPLGQMPERTFLDEEPFRVYLESYRRHRRIKAMPYRFSVVEHIEPIVLQMVMEVSERLAAVRLGISDEKIPFGTIIRELPRLIRILGEYRGELESTGLKVNVIQQHFSQIEDPKRRGDVMAALVQKLEDRLYGDILEIEASEEVETPEVGESRPEGDSG